MKHIDKNILTILAATTVSSSNLFVYCYFGKLATESYEKMSDCLYETKWWELPIELQKYFLLMNINMQRPLCYHGFDVAVLNLETFTQVRKNVKLILKNRQFSSISNVDTFSLLDYQECGFILHVI